MMITAATAQRMIVGNCPPIFGMIVLLMDISIAPKDTPLVANVIRPNMISMFAMVEMKG